MQEIVMIKATNSTLLPATEEDAQVLAKYKLGRCIRLKATQMSEHNGLFHQKLILLFRLCYDTFSEQADVGIEYKGQKVQPSFDAFREELTILAGHYTTAYSLNGSFRLHAKSISYAKMGDDEKEKLFSDVINAGLKHVYRMSLSEDQLRQRIDQLLAFDR